jgi:hypothetical protein
LLYLRVLRELRGETPENENKAKTNPIKPNFSEVDLRSKPKNKDSIDFYKQLFMQNKANL